MVNKMEIKLILFFMFVTLFFCSCAELQRNQTLCHMFVIEDNYKHFNVSNPLERELVFGIYAARECWIDIADFNIKFILTTTFKTLLTKRSRVMICIKISCKFGITVHFEDFNSTDNYYKDRIDLELIITKCSLIMSDANNFLNIGTLVLLRTIRNDVQAMSATNCSFAYGIQGIYIEAKCDTDQNESDFFWESCAQSFSNITLLIIIGCKHRYYEIIPAMLQERFPNLDTLVLNYVSSVQKIFFPWTKGALIHNKNVDNILEAYFVSFKDIFFYYMFPENSILFVRCKIKTGRLTFTGEVDMITMTGMELSYLEPNLLHNVTLKQTLDLSLNALEYISKDLLKNQHLLRNLFLHNNKLTYISNTMFAGLKELTYINLANNNIQVIVDDPFKSHYHLQDIILQNNTISYISEDAFRDQTGSIEFLSLDFNPGLSDIPVWPIYSVKLYEMSIRHCNITGEGFIRFLDRLDELDVAETLVDRAMDHTYLPLGNFANIDIGFNQMKTIPSKHMNAIRLLNLKYLFRNFMIGFEGNPITCNCDTSVIQEVIDNTDDLVTMEKNLVGFLCNSPQEFQGRYMWTINDTEKYCPIWDSSCPVSCLCFKRNGQDVIIVDCRDTTIRHMPKYLPNFLLELWFQNSKISDIHETPYLENVTVLNLSGNNLKHLTPLNINQLKRLKVLHLHSNHLTSLPFQVRSLSLSMLTLSDNPFVCDCSIKWMKRWLLNDEHLVPDWTKVKCLDYNSTLRQLISVPDSDFVCRDDSFSVSEHVIFPSVIIGSSLFVIVVLTLFVYFQRFNVKVLLFVWFKLHPFDKQTLQNKAYVFDAVIIYTEDDNTLRVEIANHLTEKGYSIADIYRNSFIGYTYIENIEILIQSSNKVILLLSEYAMNDNIIQAAWHIAYDRAMLSILSSIILVTDKNVKKQRDVDVNLRQFLKSDNFIEKHSFLLNEKIEYLMQTTKRWKSLDVEMEPPSSNVDNEYRGNIIQISYPNEYHSYVKYKIMPFLSSNKIQSKILDMEFTPGADIRDQLPEILDASRHMIFIFSEESLTDDVKLYILSQALTKTQLENHNYLLLCTSGRVCFNQMNNAVCRYVDNYVTVSVNDSRFKERLLESITLNYNVTVKKENALENEPLL